MRTRFTVVALAALCAATVASAQNPDPLPGRLVGHYMMMREKKILVIPVELMDIKMDGGKVTGIVANYQNPAGACVAEKTPFNGTYQDGKLSIKSMPMVSQRPDVKRCAPLVIDVKLSAGRASGTYKAGPLEGLIDFEAK